jgi:hypothetical protein
VSRSALSVPHWRGACRYRVSRRQTLGSPRRPSRCASSPIASIQRSRSGASDDNEGDGFGWREECGVWREECGVWSVECGGAWRLGQCERSLGARSNTHRIPSRSRSRRLLPSHHRAVSRHVTPVCRWTTGGGCRHAFGAVMVLVRRRTSGAMYRSVPCPTVVRERSLNRPL